MFKGERVSHKKFGNGIIIDFEMNSQDTFKSIIKVEFDDGNVKRLAIAAMAPSMGLMKSENNDTMEFVEKLEKESKESHKKVIEIKKKIARTIPHYSENEEGKEVTLEDWKEAYRVADEYRFPNESRAVVMDNKCVFINASAGCRYIEINPKQCDKVYKSAEGKIGKFMGHKWKYASKDVIQNIIDKMEEGEEKDNDIK